MLSDGDSKTFNNLVSMNIYGDDCELRKEECVNQVAKRIGSALCKAKTDASKRGKTLGGHGQGTLTDPVIDKLTRYYGKAIHDNEGDAEGMAKAVMATLHHVSSTDGNPIHQFCQQGEVTENWELLSEDVKQELATMNDLYCGKHLVLNLQEYAASALCEWEKIEAEDGKIGREKKLLWNRSKSESASLIILQLSGSRL